MGVVALEIALGVVHLDPYFVVFQSSPGQKNTDFEDLGQNEGKGIEPHAAGSVVKKRLLMLIVVEPGDGVLVG